MTTLIARPARYSEQEWSELSESGRALFSGPAFQSEGRKPCGLKRAKRATKPLSEMDARAILSGNDISKSLSPITQEAPMAKKAVPAPILDTDDEAGERGQLTGSVLPFLFAGHAIFTLVSKRTGTRFTYKVSAPSIDRATGQPLSPDGSQVHFVAVLTGADNNGDYTFAATIFDRRNLRPSRKSSISSQAPSMLGFSWFLGQVLSNGGQVPAGVEFYHEGRCARCGRRLTVPESITSGFGPDCAGKMGM